MEVKEHPFFANLNWGDIQTKKVPGPLRPLLYESHFDAEYLEDLTQEALKDLTSTEKKLTENGENQDNNEQKFKFQRKRSIQISRDDLQILRSSRIALTTINLVLQTDLDEQQAGGSMSHRLPVIQHITVEDGGGRENEMGGIDRNEI